MTRTLLLLLALIPAVSIGAEPGPVSLFVSILPQKYITERIGAEHVNVHVMVPPGASPVTYEPTPRQMVLLAGVKLYYRIGVPFETAWMERIQAVNPDMKVLDAREGVALRRMMAAENDAESGHAHRHHSMDPHVWLSPSRMMVMGQHLAEELQVLDPLHREDYRRNLEIFRGDLDALDTELRAVLKDRKSMNFMVFHPSWGYFADDYGLTQVPIETEGKEPGARALAQLIDTGRRRRVKTLIVERQFNQERPRVLAQAIGARVEELDPLAEDYISNMRVVARAIAEAAYE